MLLLSLFPDEDAKANRAKALPEVTQVGGSVPEWAADLQAGAGVHDFGHSADISEPHIPHQEMEMTTRTSWG